MSIRQSRILVALCGIFGVAALGIYFAVPFPMPPADATVTQVADLAKRHSNMLFLGAWLQATGSLLSVVFFLAIVHLAGAASRLAGMVTVVASAVLLAVGLFEGALTIDVAQAAANGHPQTALTSFDLMGVFVHVFPMGPAPAVYLALGAVLLGSRLLPRVLGYLALVLGAAFEIVGFAGLFSATALNAVIFLLIAQELWIVAAAIMLVARSGRPAIAAQADDD